MSLLPCFFFSPIFKKIVHAFFLSVMITDGVIEPAALYYQTAPRNNQETIRHNAKKTDTFRVRGFLAKL